MAKEWLLKVAGQDDDKDTALVLVTSKSSDDLDLDLLATESTVVFKGKVRRRNVHKLRSKNYNGSTADLEAILKFALLEGHTSTISEDQRNSLEVRASVNGSEGEKILSVTFQNRIDEITQRIGVVELEQDDEQEISLFDWAMLAVEKRETRQLELSALSQRANDDESTIAQLLSQIADLVKAKAEHEQELLAKFVILLNNKKERIRDLQRILQTATPSRDRLDYLKASRSPGDLRNTTTRTNKRSAPLVDDSGEDESQAFETQDDGRRRRDKEEENEIDSEKQNTPDSTESEPEDSDDELPIRTEKVSTRKSSTQKTGKSDPAIGSSGPGRTLPSSSKGKYNAGLETQTKLQSPPPEDDEKTASEDDEL